ncbi:MAG: hypothetical protein AAF916_01570 [Planctomycetota bacterium]
MTWELIYTSAPCGLAEGSRGFCTVAATAGMPASLIPRVEALSGYRPMPADADTPHPIQYTHVRLEHAGQTLSVLSRIVHAGHDYSGRTNKLAHHVVLEPHEQPTAGPADWMLRFTGWRDTWDDAPRTLEAITPKLEPSPTASKTWKAVAGDEGYAGWLAERLLLDPSRPTYLHHDPSDHDALGLIDEAIAQLPESARWRATFATYFTDPLPESGVAWRGLVVGSPAAETLQQAHAAGNALDLLGDLPTLGDTRYIDAARGTASSAVAEKSNASSHDADLPTQSQPQVDRESAAAVHPSMPGRGVEPGRAIADSYLRPERTRAEADHHSPNRVPTTWFLAAALGWPLVLGGAVWWAWPQSEGGVSVPTATIASTSNGLKREASAEASDDRELARLRTTLAGAEAEIAALVAALDSSTSKRDEASNEPIAVKPVIESGASVDASHTAETPTAVAPSLSAARPDRPIVPTSIEVELPRPRLASSGSAAFGSLASLSPSELVLWASSPGLPVAAVRIEPAELKASDATGLLWQTDGLEVTLSAGISDALGGRKQTVLARCRWDEVAGSLVWSWEPASLDRALADALGTIGDEASLSVVTLEDTSGHELASVHTRVTELVTTRIGEAITFSNPAPSLASLRVQQMNLSVSDLPAAWTASGETTPVTLRGPRGASLSVELSADRHGDLTLLARWHETPTDLQVKHDALAAELAEDRAWLDELERARRVHAEQRDALPKDEFGQPDDDARSDPRWLADFERLDELADAIGRVRDQRDAEPAEVHASLDDRGVQQADLAEKIEAMDQFAGFTLELRLASSGSRLARVEVTP